MDGSIFDPEAEEAHEQIEAVECERREDPWAGVDRVVADGDEECREDEYAGGSSNSLRGTRRIRRGAK